MPPSSAGAASTDPFVRVRFAMEDEMRKVRIANEADREKMWNKLDRNGDNVVELSEVEADEGKDLRMDMKEFQFCLTMAGVKLSPAKAQAEFAKVDVNGGGQILFDEFCTYFVAKKCPEGMTAFVSDE
mmetsp:Transcript_83848/g.218399  ORF Transcript_83848/g.218399 Transcript_83848/m.218399 type:complete len:128 (-) Transcript_83848:80-463(-)